jgi:hypothetical protein
MQSSNVEGTKEAKTPLIEVQKDQVAWHWSMLLEVRYLGELEVEDDEWY